jgi:hypothetical protein
VQYVAYKQSVPRLVQLTLIPITFGVGFATVYDVSLNMVGTGTGYMHLFDSIELITDSFHESYFFFPLFSICHLCCHSHSTCANFYQYISEILRLQCYAITVSYFTVYIHSKLGKSL